MGVKMPLSGHLSYSQMIDLAWTAAAKVAALLDRLTSLTGVTGSVAVIGSDDVTGSVDVG